MRLKERKFGRTTEGAGRFGATGLIKVGFNVNADKTDKIHKQPGRLSGFLLCRNQTDQYGNLIVDIDGMQRLGPQYTAAAIQQAKATGVKAAPGLLPDTLNFAILADAEEGCNGEWDFGATYSEVYERYGSLGRMCHGDGETARERLPQGGEKTIDCIPLGRDGKAPKDCCQYSANGDCKTRGTICLSLFVPGAGADDPPQPVDTRLGWQGVWRLDTGSEYSMLQIVGEFERAAKRLDGNIVGLNGVLTYALTNRRTGKTGKDSRGKDLPSVGRVGMISAHLDEQAIRAREMQRYERQIDLNRSRQQIVFNPAGPQDLNGGPPAGEPRDVEAETVDPEEPKAAAWDEGEPTDAPSTDLASAHEWNAYDLAGKSLEQILLALDRYIDEEVEATGMIWEEASEKVLWFEHEKRTHEFASTDHFRDQNISDRQREQRFRAAQAIAQRLLDDPESGFFIQDPGA